MKSHERISEEGFLRLSPDEQMIVLIRLAEKEDADLDDFKLYQSAIISGTDKDVKFTALKRIHLFKRHADLLPMMNRLRQQESSKDLEPYFSIALSRLGVISLNEFQNIFK
ncbi:hypothetical protein Q5H92_17820 [Hymenobacter sp. M29]|uniref:HEAT repeat domain-containing protein n=1 Tax=Hymenobacter mellowenesis TaxID=3063995 RepID=A0ABT9AEG8_9BACT|nr:hypothetical protein [Hymenobacter sp. M29]MDO7848230.1 hypothetical protein [Hymenobacter sp. M29]